MPALPWPAGRAVAQRAKAGARGMALIDCLVYIALLALILELAFACFYRTTEHATRLERNTSDIVRALHAGERWREDVRSATSRPSVEARAEEVEFRIPRGDTEIVYLWRSGAVLRQTGRTGAAEVLLPKVNESTFHRDERRQLTSYRWELELAGQPEISRVRPQFTFQAVAPARSKP